MTKKDGLQRILDFLDVLNRKSVEFHIDQQAPDSLTVTFALVGSRIEVDFDVDMMQYSIFKGDEAIELDERKLFELIEEKKQ